MAVVQHIPSHLGRGGRGGVMRKVQDDRNKEQVFSMSLGGNGEEYFDIRATRSSDRKLCSRVETR